MLQPWHTISHSPHNDCLYIPLWPQVCPTNKIKFQKWLKYIVLILYIICLITTKFCTYQDSSAVLVCAKFCCDQIAHLQNVVMIILYWFEFDEIIISKMGNRAHFTNHFYLFFKCDVKFYFTAFPSLAKMSLKILHMSWQHSSHDMVKFCTDYGT